MKPTCIVFYLPAVNALLNIIKHQCMAWCVIAKREKYTMCHAWINQAKLGQDGRFVSPWILHIDLSQAEFTHHSSCIRPTSTLSTLPNTLCKINHTLNVVNRLWNENGERVVMFLCIRCGKINKYWAGLSGVARPAQFTHWPALRNLRCNFYLFIYLYYYTFFYSPIENIQAFKVTFKWTNIE